ncbi:MAG TPA: 30S ribosomal protein S17 [Kofleriaceae bacterium]|jgi:small subunit ribosomal protein S17|nr:30S ribosomal protein S17 [Kofleriaceae bacterium]
MSDPTAVSASADSATSKPDHRGSRRVIVGTVTSSNMEKTVTVTVIRRVRDRRFHKFLTRRVKYHVHDEHNTAKVGDVVEIVESRPMSKTKRWRLLSTLSRGVEPEVHASQGSADPDHPHLEK